MKAASSMILLTMALSTALVAAQHTPCYNYFLQKDKCVFSSPKAGERCPVAARDPHGSVEVFSLDAPKTKRAEPQHLEARYDVTQPAFAIGGGNGLCGFYNTSEVLGVCLWSGTGPSAENAGWLNFAMTGNCRKQIYIQRQGQPLTVKFAQLVDGCSFGATTLDVGCFRIGVTTKLFEAFNPTAEERRQGQLLSGITWDFDNLHGLNPSAGPI